MKFKRAMIFLLCAVMSLSMLACGNIDVPNGGGGDNNDPPTPGGTTTYTVIFDIGEEAKAAGVKIYPMTKDVNKNAKLGDLPTVSGTYPGYVLTGWKDAQGTAYTADSRINADVTLKAVWESSAQREEYEKKISSWAQPGHLYIHYKRFKHNENNNTTAPPAAGVAAGNPEYNSAIDSTVYADWGLWAWPKKNANGRLFNAAWVDESGAVYDVLLDHEYTDCGWDGKKKVPQNMTNTYKGAAEIGVQICQISTRTDPLASFWANDGGDNYLLMETYKRDGGDYHWFVSEAYVGTKPGQGSPTYADVVRPNPYEGDDERTKNATKTSGDNIISNSAADNSSKYPLAKMDSSFDSVNGYQIFIASFADSDGDGMGDIKGIISKLDYLKKLNIDLLWLTPFQTSTNYHGYDINDYYTVDSRWGTEADYRALMNAAHEKGMRIVMDFVLNHTSLSNEWFVKSQNLVKEENVELAGKTYDEVDYRQFYSWITKAQYSRLSATEKTHWYKDNYDYYFYSSFGSSMPELNYDYQPVRDAILDICYHWMEYGLDGFRLDAVKHIYMCNEVKGKNSSVSYNTEFKDGTGSGNNLTGNYDHVADDDTRFNYDIKRNLNFYREFNSRLKAKYPKAYVVGENLDGWDQRTAAFYQGIDSQFDFSLYYNIPRGILKAAGVPGAFGDGLGAIYNRYFRGQKAYSQFNAGYVGGQFTSNHDLPRARDRMNIADADENGDKFGSFYTNGSIDGNKHIYPAEDTLHNSITSTGTVVSSKVNSSTDMLKIYYAALMTLPGVTWLYYGDEIGMSGLMQHTLTCKQQNLITSSTASDPHEDIIYRQPMKWNKATAAAFDEDNNTSHGNAAFKIGYGDILCELVGINATDSVPSVAECTAADGSFKSGTLLDWTARLTKMRKDKGITYKAKVTLVNQGQTACEYKVQGTKGTINVKFSTNTGSLSGTALNGLKFTCGKMGVIITG